jgi:hypothetical protein
MKPSTGILECEFYLITKNKTRQHLWHPSTPRRLIGPEQSTELAHLRDADPGAGRSLPQLS